LPALPNGRRGEGCNPGRPGPLEAIPDALEAIPDALDPA